MTVGVNTSPDAVPVDGRDGAASGTAHALLLQLAGFLPDHLLAEARDRLASGRRPDVARAVAFEAVSQQLHLDADEIDLLRGELAGDGPDGDLAAALEELRGERQAAAWLFLSALPVTRDDAAVVVRPLDLTDEPREHLDAVDRALVAEVSAAPGVRAAWRAWRMPPSARPWQEPVRVAVVSVEDTVDSLPALAVRLHRAMAAAGDADAQAEVCRAGLDVPVYQTLARSGGALLWASRPAAPLAIAPVFDGVDPDRGPWFTTNRPVVADDAERGRLVTALRSAAIIMWNSTRLTDVFAPERGDVVPQHLRTDGNWVWSDAVAHYLEQYGLAPDPGLAAHLTGPDRPGPLDEIAAHRALVHLVGHRSGATVRQPPGAGDGPVSPDDPSPEAPAVWDLWRPGEPTTDRAGGPERLVLP